ncbi:MAG: iron-containing alcohol dehydrogenase [Syntrophales bacterium]|nr:iron-containing alcohol dehydrogenase [Syntrophales bacterium]
MMREIFSFTVAGKIIFGQGAFDRLVDCVKEMGKKNPFIVIDNGLLKTGIERRLSELFSRHACGFSLFDKIAGEPPIEIADEAALMASEKKADLIIGIGGGSAMDVAKAAAVLVTNGGNAEDYLGLNKVPGPGLPKIMIPTTAGTGSEVTFTSVFIRRDLKKKEGINSPFLYPEMALLDPLLTLSVPPEITAATGIDALCHAIESYISISASPASEMISSEAIGLISSNLRTAVHNGADTQARESMMLGSLYAGIGLANAGVTAVHALSYPLGGRYGISHGLANTVLLPSVLRFNLPGAMEKLAAIAEMTGEVCENMSVREAAFLAVEGIEELIWDCGVVSTLETLGIKKEDFADLADAALTVTRPLANNPRKISRQNAMDIYEDAF